MASLEQAVTSQLQHLRQEKRGLEATDPPPSQAFSSGAAGASVAVPGEVSIYPPVPLYLSNY